jgi:hypothetical protein
VLPSLTLRVRIISLHFEDASSRVGVRGLTLRCYNPARDARVSRSRFAFRRSMELGVRRWACIFWSWPLIAGCAFWGNLPTLPDSSRVVRDQLVIHSDFALPRRHRLLEELAAMRGDVGIILDLPASDEPIQVFLFEDPRDYRSYIDEHYPEFPDRRAFFVESDTQLTVYAHWGDRVGEDLRHEVAHGYLHAVTPSVPLWLDEGIAEFFEPPRGNQGLNVPHVNLLSKRYQQGTWQPDIRRLEAFDDVSSMTQVEYAEAWLWVHFLLQTTRDRRVLLQNYLTELRRSATGPPFSQILYHAQPQAEIALVGHLEVLATR